MIKSFRESLLVLSFALALFVIDCCADANDEHAWDTAPGAFSVHTVANRVDGVISIYAQDVNGDSFSHSVADGADQVEFTLDASNGKMPSKQTPSVGSHQQRNGWSYSRANHCQNDCHKWTPQRRPGSGVAFLVGVNQWTEKMRIS
jgi:hypothetical protein